MTVILMRHVEYGDGPGWVSYLTEKGKAQADSIASQLIERGTVPDRILHSPRGQAVETAKRLSDVFRERAQKEIPIEARIWLADGEWTEKEVPPGEVVLLVTHKENFSTYPYDLGATFGQMPKADHGVAMIFEGDGNPREVVCDIRPQP